MITITIFANLITSIRGSVLGYETYRIPSTSMHPTLQVGDIITANTRYQTPQVGDVIVFLYPNDRKSPFVMRLAAKNGDVVSIKDGVVIRNGKAEHKLNVPEKNRQSPISLFMSERTIPQNEVFVLGDFRDNSNDSRFWGYVPYDDITGKVEYIWLSTNPDRIGMRVD
jgi:signal peptidase I